MLRVGVEVDCDLSNDQQIFQTKLWKTRNDAINNGKEMSLLAAWLRANGSALFHCSRVLLWDRHQEFIEIPYLPFAEKFEWDLRPENCYRSKHAFISPKWSLFCLDLGWLNQSLIFRDDSDSHVHCIYIFRNSDPVQRMISFPLPQISFLNHAASPPNWETPQKRNQREKSKQIQPFLYPNKVR